MSPTDADKPEEAPRVLLVEDTLDEALIIRTLLESQLGCRVSLAQDGIRGCELAENQEWDLVVTDLNIPGRDGMEVIATSKKTHPGTPILAATAYSGPDFQDHALRQGADEVLTKPLDRDEFVQKTRVLLERAREAAGETGKEGPARSVLALAALPGDAILGCGGILLSHRAHGHRVGLLVFAAGGEDEAVDQRRAEAEKVAEIAGVELVLADPFGSGIPGVERMIAEAERAVEAFGPDVVYTPSPDDVRDSRVSAHEAGLVAASDAPDHYCYQGASTNLDFRPTIFIDVTERMERKLEILEVFNARADFRPHLQPHIGKATAQYWGRFLGYREVEPLEVIRSAR
ncbi:MAG: response regulator [Gemmatimonadetes bacterium]|nr:response regulator [Gemmatimonadota bacterium]NIR78057.1 response regulator [Gemmatimonadota bacterium]NIT86618.1 response regulator [Gemmatimonadota bacterium]NIU30463.1 response regulator [Gemmatimonadota bacterium]NIU35322.1 response regulator [Gemmatimonadota bacterium]